MKDPGAHPNRRPLLALILLSPVIAEMLSGSTPPLEWLNPIAALLLIWLYGAGVLVMRETAVRWKTGWPSILLLGAAYGIIEEGLAVKSFFDPNWMDLGSLGWYGRWIDVNWIWAVWLTIFHAVISTSVPIFLTEWIWPRIRGQPLTTRRGYVTAIVLLAAATVTINVLLTPYRPSAWHLLGALAAIIFLVWAAWRYADRLWAMLPAKKLSRAPVSSLASCSLSGERQENQPGGPDSVSHSSRAAWDSSSCWPPSSRSPVGGGWASWRPCSSTSLSGCTVESPSGARPRSTIIPELRRLHISRRRTHRPVGNRRSIGCIRPTGVPPRLSVCRCRSALHGVQSSSSPLLQVK